MTSDGITCVGGYDLKNIVLYIDENCHDKVVVTMEFV